MATNKVEPKKPRVRRRRTPVGAPPGTLIADPKALRPVVRLLAYGPDGVSEEQVGDLQRIGEFLHRWPVTWVNLDGLGDIGVISKLGEIFDLHRLALEDVVNVYQRPKVEQYGENLFIIARMILFAQTLETEQISLFVGKDFVLTFQERPGDCFNPLRDRIRKAQGRIRQAGPDYLAYGLLDSVIDGYFPVLEQYGEQMEDLEQEVVTRPEEKTIGRIHGAKRQLLTLRRTLWPMREMLNSLVRDAGTLFAEESRLHLRDCYDHTIQILDMLETYRETASGLLDVYLSSVSNRINATMKVLTIIATIFMPLSFIASLYGMNFNSGKSPWNMPELNWYWGYPAVLAVMLVVFGGMLLYFRRKGWLG